MAFSTATITHTFKNADGSAASGEATFTLTDEMTNGSVTIAPATVVAVLTSDADSDDGLLSQLLTSNVDTATWVLASTATGGSLELGYNDGQLPQWTLPIQWNATAAQIQAAFAATVEPGGIATPGILGFVPVITGGPLPTSITIAGVPGAGVFQIPPRTDLLTGGSATITETVTGTVPSAPQNTQWRVDLRITGASVRTFFITVPAGGGTVDLFTLIPDAQQVSGG